MGAGRKFKLTESQLSEAWARHLAGDTLEVLGVAYGISAASLSRRFAGRKDTLKSVAHGLVSAEKQLAELPVYEQVAVRHFADELKEISYHLGGAAKYGAMSAHRLATIAQGQAERVSDVDPLGESSQELQAFAVLTESANKAAQTGINLIKAVNQDKERDKAPADDRAELMREIASRLPD